MSTKRALPRFLGDDLEDDVTHDDILGLFDDDVGVAPAGATLPGETSAFTQPSTTVNAIDVDDIVADVETIDKPKRKRPRVLNEDVLLGPSGFPKLVEHSKKLKFKGKGHEHSDLKRLLRMYQIWAHEMYPKTNLKDTLDRVEKLSHKRTVQYAVRNHERDARNGDKDDGERDYFENHPLTNANNASNAASNTIDVDAAANAPELPHVPSDDPYDNLFDADELEAARELDEATTNNTRNDNNSNNNNHDFDDDDELSVLRELEMESRGATTVEQETITARNSTAGASFAPDFDAEEEEALNMLEGIE